MSRTLVSQAEIIQWMNAELSQHKECLDCHFSTITPLAEPDADGCNWSPAWLQCTGKPVAECKPIANQVADEAKKLFNLATE